MSGDFDVIFLVTICMGMFEIIAFMGLGTFSVDMKKIRVLQLGSPSGLYGAERWILALIKNLNPERIEVWVGSIKDEPEQEVPLCQEAERLGFYSQIFESYGKFNFSAVIRLKKFILQQKIDILHTHGYKTDLIGLIGIQGTACKVVSTPHGWTNQPDFKLRCYEIIDRLIFPFFDAVVPLSEGIYTQLKRLPGLKKKLHLIQNGVDTQEIESAKRVFSEISEWRAEGAFVIGYIGRLTSGKGLDVLLQAVADYGEPHWRVAIVGQGEQERKLKSMIRRLNIYNSIKFFGFRADRLSFLKGFDVFVLPSRSEGIPRSLMEAMVAGVPVVASDIPGCRNLVEHEKTGMLFQTDNAKLLADAIVKIATNPLLKNNLSLNAHRFIYSQYSASKMGREYTMLYSNLMYTL